MTIELDVQDVTLHELVESAKALVARRTPHHGLTGAPGAGKSTVAEQLVTALRPDIAVLVTMDGFHLANEVLIDLDEVWFLAPDTDVRHARLIRRHEARGKSPEDAALWALGSRMPTPFHHRNSCGCA